MARGEDRHFGRGGKAVAFGIEGKMVPVGQRAVLLRWKGDLACARSLTDWGCWTARAAMASRKLWPGFRKQGDACD